jgi:hypothetical protein
MGNKAYGLYFSHMRLRINILVYFYSRILLFDRGQDNEYSAFSFSSYYITSQRAQVGASRLFRLDLGQLLVGHLLAKTRLRKYMSKRSKYSL